MARFEKGNAGKPKGAKNKNPDCRSQQATKSALGNENKKGVYFIKCGDSKFYKIGKTSNLRRRIYDIQIVNPYPIILCKFIECQSHGKLEKAIHNALSDYKHYGEWFILSDAVFSALMTINDIEDIESFKEKLKPNLFTILN